MDCDELHRDPTKRILNPDLLVNVLAFFGVVDIIRLSRVSFYWFEAANTYLHQFFNEKDHRYNWLRDHIDFGMSPYSLKNIQKMYTTILNEDTRQKIVLFEKLEKDQGIQNVQYVERVQQIIFKNYKFLRKILQVPVTKVYLLDYTFWKLELGDKKLCCNCKDVLKTDQFYDSVCFYHPGQKYIEEKYRSVCWTCCGPSGPTRGCEATDHHVEATFWNPAFVPKKTNPLDYSVQIKVISNDATERIITAKMRQNWNDISDQILKIVCNGSASNFRNTNFYVIQRRKLKENLYPVRVEPTSLIFDLYFISNVHVKTVNSSSKLELHLFAVRPNEDEITLRIHLFPNEIANNQRILTKTVTYGMETNELCKDLAMDLDMDDDLLKLEFSMGIELPKSRDSILKSALRFTKDFSPFRQPLELCLLREL